MSDIGEGVRIILSQQLAEQSGDFMRFIRRYLRKIASQSRRQVLDSHLQDQLFFLSFAHDETTIRTVHFGGRGRNLQIQWYLP